MSKYFIFFDMFLGYVDEMDVLVKGEGEQEEDDLEDEDDEEDEHDEDEGEEFEEMMKQLVAIFETQQIETSNIDATIKKNMIPLSYD